MKKQPIFNRNQLALAVSVALLGSVMTGCSSSSDSAAPPGEATASANGGTGGPGGQGGWGGEISLENWGGSGGINVKKAGVANTNFTSPINPAAADLGDRPLDIAADTLIALVIGFSTPVADASGSFAAGDLYVDENDEIRVVAAAGPASYANDGKLSDGTPYVRDSEDGAPRVWIKTAAKASDDNYATGMSVATEAIAIIDRNDGGCSTYIAFPADIDNNGTISRRDGNEGCSLQLMPNTYLGEGDIYNAGVDGAEDGGSVRIFAATGIANMGTINVSGYTEEDAGTPGGQGGEVVLQAGGYVINDGTLNAAGGDGTEGSSDGGVIYMDAAYTENNGELHAQAGTYPNPDSNLVGPTGDGGIVAIFADYVANNTGAVNLNGADGASGGQGGEFILGNFVGFDGGEGFMTNCRYWNGDSYITSGPGEVKNAGAVSAIGGDGAESSGGQGGEVFMMACGGALLNNADLDVSGGGSDFEFGSGGYGGIIEGMTDNSGDTAAGDLVISGNLWANGGEARGDDNGAAGYGGKGGAISFEVDADADNGKAYNAKLSLLGYAGLSVDGGDGGVGGPGGGSIAHNFSPWPDNGIYFETDYEEDDPNGYKVYAGSISNDVPLSARGGNGTLNADYFGMMGPNGDGGEGGGVTFDATDDTEVALLNITATNTADVDVSEGDATSFRPDGDDIFTFGSMGGEFRMWAFKNVDNSGDVDAGGGENYTVDGGNGGEAELSSEAGTSRNTGAVDASGADGGEYGGHGGELSVYGAIASNIGAVDISGANATFTDTDAFTWLEGGDGGFAEIVGQGIEPNLSTNSGEVNYTFGTGTTSDGEEGCLQVGITFEGNCTGFGLK